MIRMDQEVVISYDFHKRIFLLLFSQESPLEQQFAILLEEMHNFL